MAKYPTSVQIGGMVLSPPWTNASGFLATPPACKRLSTYRTGGVVGKTLLVNEEKGHESPVVVEGEDGVTYNAIGLAGPGAEKFRKEMSLYFPFGVPYIQSVASKESPDEIARLIDMLEGLYNAIELNVSCPNVAAGMLAGQDPRLTRTYTLAAKRAAGRKPVIVKLTPNVDDIEPIALAAADAGADSILAINTKLGKYINPYTGEPHLTNKTGGMSGHGIIEDGLGAVEVIARMKASHGFVFKIGGVGGIRDAHDARRYFAAGADYIQFGTHLFKDRPMEIRRKGVETVQEFLERMYKETYGGEA